MDLDRNEAMLDAPDFADSYTVPEAADAPLGSLNANSDGNARLFFTIESAWYFARRHRYAEAAEKFAQSEEVDGIS